jgi:hypothetical protein
MSSNKEILTCQISRPLPIQGQALTVTMPARVHESSAKRIYEGQAAVLFALVAHDTRFNSVSQEHDLGKQSTPKKGREL